LQLCVYGCLLFFRGWAHETFRRVLCTRLLALASGILLLSFTHPPNYAPIVLPTRAAHPQNSSRLVLTFCVKDIIAWPAGCTLGVVLPPSSTRSVFNFLSFHFHFMRSTFDYITIDIFGLLAPPLTAKGANPQSYN